MNNNNKNFKSFPNAHNRASASFSLPLILNYLNISVPVDATPLFNFSLGILLLALLTLLCFLNVVGYLASIILINKYDIETKYPKLQKIIKYYNNSTLFIVVIEGIMCLFFLFCIIFSSLFMLGVIIT